jgi:RHS repeat-associated protein
VAVGASGYVTIYNGSSWSTPTDADSTRTLDALSCVSSSFCVAVDTSGYATIYNGSSWSTPTDIDSTRSIDAVKCVSSSFCVAVGASGYVTIYNGSSWSTPTDADSTRTLDALSCVSSSFCVAVDTSGYAAKYNGSTWTATDIDSTRSIDAVQCVSSSFCVAAGASGYATVYNGSSWSTPTDADSSRTIKAVSCPTSSLCVAVDTSGYATVYNGSSWSTPTDIDGSHAFQALSCASSSFCEATDNAGNVLTYNGSSWSAAQDIDAARTISSVSCTSSTFCAAVDSSGYATVYRFVTLTSQFTWDTNGSLSLVLSDGINDYIYGPGTTPVEEVSISSSTPSYMTYTPADSSWLITNAAGDEIAFYGYDAFGNLAFGTPASPFGYAGQYTDPSTGFSDLRARWYEGQTGNFTTRDPAFASTDSAYTYAGDDPVNGIDPMGMSVNLSGAAQWAQGDASPGDNNGFRDDCTDFVSRALHIGGGDPETYSWDFAADLAHKHDPYYWFQVQDLLGLVETSSTWANARDLFAHFIDNGSSLVVADFPLLSAKSDTSGCEPSNAYALPYGIQAGDVIFVNWSGSNPSGIGHAGIVIYVESGQLWIAQHTPNRIDTLTKWASGGSDPFIWIFDPNEG